MKTRVQFLTVPENIPPKDSSYGLLETIFKKIHIAFNSGMLLYYEAKNIPTVNQGRKLALRDVSIPPSPHLLVFLDAC